LVSDGNVGILLADASEIETINLMVEAISRIPEMAQPQLRQWLATPSSITRLRDFASFVAQEETFTVGYGAHDGAKTMVEQKVLFIGKCARVEEQLVNGTWSSFFKGSIHLPEDQS
jgi:hypothetical protein